MWYGQNDGLVVRSDPRLPHVIGIEAAAPDDPLPPASGDRSWVEIAIDIPVPFGEEIREVAHDLAADRTHRPVGWSLRSAAGRRRKSVLRACVGFGRIERGQ